jgi:hypothetical protein
MFWGAVHSKSRDFILSLVPSSFTEQALNDFKTQSSLHIQEILTKRLPIKPEQKNQRENENRWKVVADITTVVMTLTMNVSMRVTMKLD